MSSYVHLKGLNGLRIIAAVAVVISHIGLALQEFGVGFVYSSDLAGYGVTIFFSLSGFLITYLLLLEKAKTGGINIKAFYFRRILRIWPLYYFYLLLVVITLYLYLPDQLPGGILFYIFLCANIPFVFQFPLPFVTHYWSLGVEEQFYLFWPWVVRKIRKLFQFVLVFIILFVIVKIGLRYIDAKTTYHWPYILLHTTRFDCMAIGAAGAILFEKKHAQFLKICYSLPAQIIAWGCIVLLAFNKFHLASVIDSEIIAVITVILIVNVSSNPKTLVNLEVKLLDFLGKISYGIYVYHPLVIFFSAKIIKNWIEGFNDGVKLAAIVIWVLGLTILIAWLSFTYFEKRFLKLKARFSPVKSVDTISENKGGSQSHS